jgi:hypothetical protein
MPNKRVSAPKSSFSPPLIKPNKGFGWGYRIDVPEWALKLNVIEENFFNPSEDSSELIHNAFVLLSDKLDSKFKLELGFIKKIIDQRGSCSELFGSSSHTKKMEENFEHLKDHFNYIRKELGKSEEVVCLSETATSVYKDLFK